MYHVVQFVMADSNAHSRLLDAAVAQAMDGGITDLSLREIAATIGTSHRMLFYHFKNREGLLVAVTDAVEVRQRQAAYEHVPNPASFRATWERVSDASLRPQKRLFFELYSSALLKRPRMEAFLERAMESWRAPASAALVTHGAEPSEARADARLALAVVRGSLLDLLATGNQAGVNQAIHRYIDTVQRNESAIHSRLVRSMPSLARCSSVHRRHHRVRHLLHEDQDLATSKMDALQGQGAHERGLALDAPQRSPRGQLLHALQCRDRRRRRRDASSLAVHQRFQATQELESRHCAENLRTRSFQVHQSRPALINGGYGPTKDERVELGE
jgi:AcrR family transcriptional regulator